MHLTANLPRNLPVKKFWSVCTHVGTYVLYIIMVKKTVLSLVRRPST